MSSPKPLAGGCFLTLCILVGLAAGLALGDPMKGIVIGTAVGTLLATGLWLVNRRQTDDS